MTAKTPVRTCVGCKAAVEKTELLRVVQSPNGIIWDELNSKPGRGAYLHPNLECIEKALNRGGLNRAFRTNLNAEMAKSNLMSSIPPLSTRSVTGMKTR